MKNREVMVRLCSLLSEVNFALFEGNLEHSCFCKRKTEMEESCSSTDEALVEFVEKCVREVIQ